VPSVMADPDKLRELSKKLKAAGNQVEGLGSQLIKTLQSTGWNDRERQKFEQALAADLKAATAVARRLQNEYPAILERKARALDEFRR
jgi:hypothetical protein